MAGEYTVLIAMDGQQFFDTNTRFIAYNIESIECKPDKIVLSQYNDDENTLNLEIKVKGFVATNPDNIKLKFIGDAAPKSDDNDGDKTMFITDCIYQSQHA